MGSTTVQLGYLFASPLPTILLVGALAILEADHWLPDPLPSRSRRLALLLLVSLIGGTALWLVIGAVGLAIDGFEGARRLLGVANIIAFFGSLLLLLEGCVLLVLFVAVPGKRGRQGDAPPPTGQDGVSEGGQCDPPEDSGHGPNGSGEKRE